jgi:hypothetical protein
MRISAEPVATESQTGSRSEVRVIRALLICLGLAAAVAYCLLMPLWEGYDEPFHYGIVQSLGIERTFADPSRTLMSEELWQSRLLAPVSPVFNRDVPPIKTFSQFRALPEAEQQALRQSLERVPPELQYRPHPGPPNYEAQQPPLSYILLAIPDRLLSRAPITTRALVLRLLIAVFTVLVCVFGMLRLGDELGIPEPFLLAAIMLVLMTQTFLGAVCRISNDWLGIALAPWLVVKAIGVLRSGTVRETFGLGACLAIGLLAKANYVAFAPLAFGVVAFACLQRKLPARAVAAFAAPILLALPWYARNIVLYGSLTGWHPHVTGAHASGALAALLRVPWLTYLPRFARGALWNGNNHSLAFSRTTLDLFLLLLVAASVLAARALWTASDRHSPIVAAAACGLYAAALAYSVGELFLVYADDYTIAPWYCPPLFTVLAPLLFWGMSRSGRLGHWTGLGLLALATYIFAATWLLKLIPLYAGFPGGPVKLGALTSWYFSSWRAAHSNLATVAMGSVWIVYLLVSVSLACAIALLSRYIRDAIRSHARKAGVRNARSC